MPRYGSASRKGTNGATATYGGDGRHQQHAARPGSPASRCHAGSRTRPRPGSRCGHAPSSSTRRPPRTGAPARRIAGARVIAARTIASTAMPRFSHVTIRMIRASHDSSSAGSGPDRCDGIRVEGIGLGPHEASRMAASLFGPPGGDAHRGCRCTGPVHPTKVPVSRRERAPIDQWSALAGVLDPRRDAADGEMHEAHQVGALRVAGRQARAAGRAAAPAARTASRRTGCAARWSAAGPAARP